ncbi:MAG: TRL-like family protein [Alphaproteobacteria bacterium]|jgi:hypothetical protein|nr:TRL-like family protein [Alphaproteobacteria bacterium]
MKKLTIGFLILVMGALAGCAAVPSQSGSALFHSTKEPVIATTNSNATKTGEACGVNILGLISAGDFSINAAKEKGGITNVSSVDKSVTNILFLFANVCTIVRGS